MKNVVSLFWARTAPRDWSSQDLAEFYRVEAALLNAGLAVDTDRGLSDEGEPWFVFCNADTQDVIVHCARIDGVYVVASAAFEGVLRGTNFRAVVEGALTRHPMVMPRQDDPDNKIRLHPTALLVALVATAFFKLHDDAHAGTEAVWIEGSQNDDLAHVFGVKQFLNMIDKRQAAIIVAAVAYAHHDAGLAEFLEPNNLDLAAVAQVLSESDLRELDSVDALFQKIIADAAAQGTEDIDDRSSWFSRTPVVDEVGVAQLPAAVTLEARASEDKEILNRATQEVGAEPLYSALSLAHANEQPEKSYAEIALKVSMINPDAELESSITKSTLLTPSVETAAAAKLLQAVITELSLGTVIQSKALPLETNIALATPEETAGEDSNLYNFTLSAREFDFVFNALQPYYGSIKDHEMVMKANQYTDDIIKSFINNTIDFKSIEFDGSFVLFDPTPSQQDSDKFMTIVFDDHSTLSLIGNFDYDGMLI